MNIAREKESETGQKWEFLIRKPVLEMTVSPSASNVRGGPGW